MTVKELIVKLQEMPQDLTVINLSCSQEVDVVELEHDEVFAEDFELHGVDYVGIV